MDEVRALRLPQATAFLDEEEKASFPFGQLTAAAPNPSVKTTHKNWAGRVSRPDARRHTNPVSFDPFGTSAGKYFTGPP